MKKNIFVIICLSFSCVSVLNAQITNKQKKFIVDFVKNEAEKKEVYYKEKIDYRLIDQVIQMLDRTDNIHNTYRDFDGKKSNFTFSDNEKDFLKIELNKQKTFAWDSSFFKNKNIIMYKPVGATASQDEKMKFSEFFFNKKIISFSVPIFLRNNSLCFLYYEEFGGVEVIIFMKQNGIWKKIIQKWVVMS